MEQTFTSFADFKRRYPIRPNDAGTLLGSGSYGRVVKVEDQLETEWVAIKISEFKGSEAKSLKAEIELARGIPRQANIARYEACYRLETDTSVSDFAIMKYYPDGNLADLLRHVTLSPTQIYEITEGILLGLRHLHRQRIVHRDFKPANVLISRDNAGRFIPKIADFGLSKLVADEELDGSDFDLSDGRGTPSYKAPEQIEGSQVSFNLDLWAFGVILYEIMTGEKPFRADSRNSSEQSARREIEKKIVTVELPARVEEIAEPYRSMIQRCLVRDIHERARREDELLDLLDRIPELLAEANRLFTNNQYDPALGVYGQVLNKRENQAEALRGIEQCKAAIEKQSIARLLRDAESLLNRQLPEQAERLFADVLRLDPTNAEAVNGQRRCVERRRPKSVAADEPTDLYQEEQTDLYDEPPAVTVKEKAVNRPQPISPATRKQPDSPKSVKADRAAAKPLVSPPVLPPAGRAFPWRVAIPVMLLGLGGPLVYLNMTGGPPFEQVSLPRPDSVAIAGVGLTVDPLPGKNKGETGTMAPPESGAVDRAALAKRVNAALEKARDAFRQKDYGTTLMWTNSALGLDATRKDVRKLRDAAAGLAQSGTPAPTPPAETPKIAPPTVAEEKPKSDEPDPKKLAEKAKAEAQENYNQLIDDGLNAITKNNKAKAKTNFLAARSLSKEYVLNTAKGSAAYAEYLDKANRIFEREAFEGAREWYLVAQSLKETEEVRRKINQCTNLIP